MAENHAKHADNTPGSFYVDYQCIACDACVREAPHFFKMNDREGHAFVFAQPEKAQDIKRCQEALSLCPVGAIGDDGMPTLPSFQ